MRKPRRITRLCQLSDDEFLSGIADGMNLIVENARTYSSAAEALVGLQPGRVVDHLRLTAEEEAAKCLILLDAIRCPRRNDTEQLRSRTLKYFSNHLARGIYAWYACTRPATFEEARRIALEAAQSYYDGPDDYQFEHRNWILANREENLYVDYVEDNGTYYWLSPRERDSYVGGHIGVSHVIDLVQAMMRIGFGTPKGLRIVADIWRQVVISDTLEWIDYEVHNIRTVTTMREAGLSEQADRTDFGLVVDGWGYPLYSLGLPLREGD